MKNDNMKSTVWKAIRWISLYLSALYFFTVQNHFTALIFTKGVASVGKFDLAQLIVIGVSLLLLLGNREAGLEFGVGNHSKRIEVTEIELPAFLTFVADGRSAVGGIGEKPAIRLYIEDRVGKYD